MKYILPILLVVFCYSCKKENIQTTETATLQFSNDTIIFDTIFTFFRRLKNRENVFDAHRSHLYQRLVIIGYNHRFVSLCYIGLAFFGMLLAYLFSTGGEIAEWLVVFGLIVGAGSLWLFVFWQEYKRASQPT